MNRADISDDLLVRCGILTDWKWWVSGAIFSFFLASVLMTGWPSGLVPNLDYPFTYHNDGCFGAIQRVIEGWIFENPRSGYPFGSDSFDYPNSDSGNLLILKLIGLMTGEWYSAFNIYFLLGFPVTFVASFCVLRSVGLAIPFAFTAATLYSFLPFHFVRIPHLYYTWYFVVPIFWYIALKIYSLRLLKAKIKVSPLKKAFYAACLVGLGSFGIYYALFGLIMFFFTAISAIIHTRNMNSLKLFLFASCFVIVGVLMNLSPSLMHRYTNGPNIEAFQRDVASSEVYGFKFVQLILPRSGHRNASLNKITADYSNGTPLVNENFTSSLGAVGSLGLLIVFCLIFYKLSGRHQDSKLSVISLIVLILFMFGTIGGFGSIFSQVITTSIRGWNRISIFIGFGALLALFVLLQTELQKRFIGRRLVFFSSIISVIFLLGGLYDQTTPACMGCNDQTQKSFNMDKEFVQSIEKSLPTGSAIYQLPYMPFPEVPPLYRLQVYDLSMGFIYSSSLRWSYMGLKGQSGDLFYRSLAKESIEKQLEVIKRLGFAGIYIDKRGFDVNDNTLINRLTELLGTPPILTRADGEIVFFSLNNGQQNNIEGLNAEQIMQKADYFVDNLGVHYSGTYSDEIDFTRTDLPNFVKYIQGLSGLEPWGRWSDAALAPSVQIALKVPLPNHFDLVFNAQAFGPNTGQVLSVKIGTQIHYFKLKTEPSEYRKSIDLADEKVSSIEFLPPKPTSPQQLGMGSDNRLLGIGLISLRFENIQGKK